jgi:acetolactate synthase-1/2/3 large subunit
LPGAWHGAGSAGALRPLALLEKERGQKRTFGQGTQETGTNWSKDVRFGKVGEGFGCHGEYVTKVEDIKPAIARAYASGKVGVVHVVIDPKASSEEMPKYAEFRTWYAEGTQ